MIWLCPPISLGAVPVESASIGSKEKYQSVRSRFDTCQRGHVQAFCSSSIPLSLNVSRIKATVMIASGVAVNVWGGVILLIKLTTTE